MRTNRPSVTPNVSRRFVSARLLAWAASLALVAGLADRAAADSLASAQVMAPDIGGIGTDATATFATVQAKTAAAQLTAPSVTVATPVLVLASFDQAGLQAPGVTGEYRIRCSNCAAPNVSQPVTVSINWIAGQKNHGGAAWIFTQNSGATTYYLEHRYSAIPGGSSFRSGNATIVAVPLTTAGGVTLSNSLDTYGTTATEVIDTITGAVGVPVVTVSRSGTTATVTQTAHGFDNGDRVFIKGATDSDHWNGYFTIFNVTANTFDYTLPGTPGLLSPTGTVTVVRVAQIASSATLTGTTATVTTVDPHGLQVGDRVAVQGATNWDGYNGDYLVTTVPSTTQFTYTTFAGASPALGTIQVRRSAILISNINQTPSSLVVNVTTASPHGFAVGDRIAVSGLTNGENSTEFRYYQGFFTVETVPSTTQFTYRARASGLLVATGNPIVRRLESTRELTWDPNAQVVWPATDANIYTLQDGVFLRKNNGPSILETTVNVPTDPHIRRDVVLAFVATQGQRNSSNIAQWRYGNYQLVYQAPSEAGTTAWHPVNQLYQKTADGWITGSVPDVQPVVIYGKLGAKEGGTYRFRVKVAQRNGGSGILVHNATLISLGTSWDNRPTGTAGWFKALHATGAGYFSAAANEQWIDFQNIPLLNWFRTESFSRSNAASNFVGASSMFAWPTKGGGAATVSYGLGMRKASWVTGDPDAWGNKKNGANGVVEGNRSFNGTVGAACVVAGGLQGCEVGVQTSVGMAPSPTYPATGTGMPPWEGTAWTYLNGVDVVMNNDVVIFETQSNGPTWAAVEGLRAVSAGGKTTVSWNTSAEMGAASFRLERYDSSRGSWVTVGPAVIPALPPWPGGAAYQVDDPGAVAGGAYRYRVVENEVRGGETAYGPFSVVAEGRAAMSALGADASGPAWVRTPNPPGVAKTVRPSMLSMKAALPRASSSLKAWVDYEGIYAIPLASSGDSSVSRNRRMTNLGHEVAFANDGSSKRLLFYGTPLKTLYTNRNAYLVKPGSPTFMREVNGKGPAPAPQPRSFAATKHFEENLWPALGWIFDGTQDYWFWKTYMAEVPGYQSAELPLDLPLADPSGGTATATFRIHGLTYSEAPVDYHLRAWVNGAPAGDVALEGSGPLSGSVTFDASLLVRGANTLRLDAILDPGLKKSWWFLNGIDVSYPRLFEAAANEAHVRAAGGQPVVTVSGFSTAEILVFDVTDPEAPVRINALTVTATPGAKSTSWAVSFARTAGGTDYYVLGADRVHTASLVPLVEAGLASRTAGAEHVVIAPYDLVAPAEALSSHRKGEGLSSTVVPLDAVWDEFGEGLPTPAALKAFLDDAGARWTPAPRYVALAGRGTFDPGNFLGYDDCLIPTYMVGTDRGLVGSDSPYVSGSGAVIGRIPATTAAGLQAYVDKIVRHDAASRTMRATFAADNDDSDGAFAASSDMIASDFPGTYTKTKAYLGPLTVGQVKNEILAAFGRGDAVVSWVGHGGSSSLAAERVLNVTDLPSIPASDRLSLFTGATCIINGFHLVGSPSIGERLAALPGGGAFATWAPAGAAYNDTSVALVRALFGQTLGQNGPNRRIGDAIRSVQLAPPAAAGSGDAISLFQLLGDPACYVP